MQHAVARRPTRPCSFFSRNPLRPADEAIAVFKETAIRQLVQYVHHRVMTADKLPVDTSRVRYG